MIATVITLRENHCMPITMNDLTINPDGVDKNALLDDWSWAIPEPVKPVLITTMGDVFAQGTSGVVYFVDAVGGTVESVADDGASFESLLTDNNFVTQYLFPSRIVQLRNAGITLQPQQVYSHRQLLVLGGDDDAGNIESTDVNVHVSMHGQVHRQVKDLPDGTPIDNIEIN